MRIAPAWRSSPASAAPLATSSGTPAVPARRRQRQRGRQGWRVDDGLGWQQRGRQRRLERRRQRRLERRRQRRLERERWIGDGRHHGRLWSDAGRRRFRAHRVQGSEHRRTDAGASPLAARVRERRARSLQRQRVAGRSADRRAPRRRVRREHEDAHDRGSVHPLRHRRADGRRHGRREYRHPFRAAARRMRRVSRRT